MPNNMSETINKALLSTSVFTVMRNGNNDIVDVGTYYLYETDAILEEAIYGFDDKNMIFDVYQILN